MSRLLSWLFFCGLSVFLVSCDFIVSNEPNKEAVARVGRSYLYRSELPDFSYLKDSITALAAKEDYIERWAYKRLTLDNALNYLSQEDKWELDRMVENYRLELYSQAYYQQISSFEVDTIFAENELELIYEKEQSSLRLEEDLIKLRFIALSSSYTKPEEVEKRFKRYNSNDRAYIDSLKTHNYLTQVYLNDSVWVRSSSIIETFRPLTYQNAEQYLNGFQYFTLKDSLGYYFAQILETRKKGDIAPFEFAEPELKQILLNRKQFTRIEDLQNQLLKDAIRKGDFEIFN